MQDWNGRRGWKTIFAGQTAAGKEHRFKIAWENDACIVANYNSLDACVKTLAIGVNEYLDRKVTLQIGTNHLERYRISVTKMFSVYTTYVHAQQGHGLMAANPRLVF